jgi:hypothetical protein
MFDFKNNDADQVIITDIDFENDANFEKESFIINTYLFIKSKKKLDDLYFIFENFGLGKPSRDINLSMDNYSEKLKTIIPQIIAGQIVNLKRVSSNIIIKYLSNIDSNNKVHSVYSKNSEKLQKLYKTNNKKFVYGVDEYFLNYYLLDFIQKHKLEFCSKIQYNVINLIYSTLFYWNKMKNNLSKKEITFFKKFFNFILKDIDEFKFTNIQDAFNLMDKYTYYKNYKNNKKFSKNHIIIFKRLYAFYKICREKNIKYLNPMYLNFILDYMKNRLHIYEYRFYFSKKAPIILEEIILP